MEDKAHRMRFSIDIKSLKDNDFIGQVFVKFSPLVDLGITKPFRTSPLLQLSTAKVQQIFPNGFSSYYFNTTRTSLSQILNSILDVELWHSDRMKKDLLLGIVKLNISQLMSSPQRKTKQSYAKVFDAYLPVDEHNQSGEIVRKVATMRILMYLEDLGPSDSLRQKQEELGLKQPLIYDADPAAPALPSQNSQLSAQDRLRQIQLNQLEYKVVWQLQTWRKAQQAKTRIHLKQKEVQFLAQLAQEQRKNDLEKQKQFKKIQANLMLQQNKLRNKIGELQKREQKLVLLQQETQNKVTQMSRYLLAKDQEIKNIRDKAKDDKSNSLKQKSSLEAQIHALKGQNTRLKMDLEEALKQDEKSPIAIIRNELNNRINDNKMLTKALQDANEVKKLFQDSYEKIRNELINVKRQLESKRSRIQTLQTQNQVFKSNLKLLQQQLNLSNQQLRSPPLQHPTYRQQYPQQQHQDDSPPTFTNNLERLKFQRQQYLRSGSYTVDDPLIKQIDKQIRKYH